VTGDDVTGDDVTGDDVTGDDVTGDDVTGDDVTGVTNSYSSFEVEGPVLALYYLLSDGSLVPIPVPINLVEDNYKFESFIGWSFDKNACDTDMKKFIIGGIMGFVKAIIIIPREHKINQSRNSISRVPLISSSGPNDNSNWIRLESTKRVLKTLMTRMEVFSQVHILFRSYSSRDSYVIFSLFDPQNNHEIARETVMAKTGDYLTAKLSISLETIPELVELQVSGTKGVLINIEDCLLVL